VTTADESLTIRERCGKGGCAALVSKPFSTEIILDVLASMARPSCLTNQHSTSRFRDAIQLSLDRAERCTGWICERHPHQPWPHEDDGDRKALRSCNY